MKQDVGCSQKCYGISRLDTSHIVRCIRLPEGFEMKVAHLNERFNRALRANLPLIVLVIYTYSDPNVIQFNQAIGNWNITRAQSMCYSILIMGSITVG